MLKQGLELCEHQGDVRVDDGFEHIRNRPANEHSGLCDRVLRELKTGHALTNY
jgi:hypothetical protein